jgi:hypothetical protein
VFYPQKTNLTLWLSSVKLGFVSNKTSAFAKVIEKLDGSKPKKYERKKDCFG